jgi:uroporphyrinogen decarboxylase
MGNDVRQAWVNNNYAMEGIVHEHEGETHTDVWGITWEKQGEFNQIATFPLLDATPDELLAYTFPVGQLDELLAPMVQALTGSEELFVGVDVSPCVFEMYWRLRGMDTAILDMASQPDVADVMLSRCADFAALLSEESLRRFSVDWLWTGDDVAGQSAMIMGPVMWRDLIRPHLQRVVDVGRVRSMPVAYHCCGALRPIIGDLIEMGITVLNPIQCNCPGMNPLELKREFGRDLTFMGGVDTQDLLPNGTAAEVRTATERLIEGMTSDGGGFILAASHTVPPETPDENIFAMYAAAGLSREEIFDRAAAIRKTSPANA